MNKLERKAGGTLAIRRFPQDPAGQTTVCEVELKKGCGLGKGKGNSNFKAMGIERPIKKVTFLRGRDMRGGKDRQGMGQRSHECLGHGPEAL